MHGTLENAQALAGLGPDLSGTAWRSIILSERRGIWCLVDAEHADWLGQWSWNWGWHARTPWKWYAKRNEGRARSTLYLHRELLKQLQPADEAFLAAHVVDHINGNSLDNRVANLRWLTPRANKANVKGRGQFPTLDAIVAELLRGHAPCDDPPF